jgi:hypothetical protein
MEAMEPNDPRNHHCVPRFFLRNFAADEEKNRITTVAKHGTRAVWANRSIDSVGVEENFYVHWAHGVPVSVESDINHRVENPISQSDTWQKIASSRTDLLDQSDRSVLYALIRHLHTRTPHFQATIAELATMAAKSSSEIPFTQEERDMYAEMRANPALAKGFLNQMAATPEWSERNCRSSLLTVCRSPIPLRSSTTPVHMIGSPVHPAIDLPLPGMVPQQLMLTLNPMTFASLVVGDFDGAFSNRTVTEADGRGYNRHITAQFAHFEHVRHLITNRDNLIDDMCWASFDLTESTALKIIFRHRPAPYGR